MVLPRNFWIQTASLISGVEILWRTRRTRTRKPNSENYKDPPSGRELPTVIYQLEAHYIIEAHPIVGGSSQLPETFYRMKIGQFSRTKCNIFNPFYKN